MTEHDPLYIAARTVLLDALEALSSQREAIVVVGAQAVYLRTGDAGIAVAPYTTDADLVLWPARVAAEPLVEEAMREAKFRLEGGPGAWVKTLTVEGRDVDVPVDLMVGTRLAPGGGRRSVQLPPHDKNAARKAPGLEGAVVDNDLIEVYALAQDDPRCFNVLVAGPAALIVAKLHKLRDRLAEAKEDRIADKDAADVYRLVLAVPVPVFVARLRLLLDDEVAGPPSREALNLLTDLFAATGSRGTSMAAEALRTAVPRERVTSVCTAFVQDLLAALGAT